jgi:predicted kinase
VQTLKQEKPKTALPIGIVGQKVVSQKNFRMQLVLPKQTIDQLDDLKELTGASSYTEVVRRALQVYLTMTHRRSAGGSFQIIDADGVAKELILP